MTDMTIIERLRTFEGSDALGNGDFAVCVEAADRIERLEAALEQGAAWFMEYAQLHYAKHTKEGDEKARVNFERSKALSAALQHKEADKYRFEQKPPKSEPPLEASNVFPKADDDPRLPKLQKD